MHELCLCACVHRQEDCYGRIFLSNVLSLCAWWRPSLKMIFINTNSHDIDFTFGKTCSFHNSRRKICIIDRWIGRCVRIRYHTIKTWVLILKYLFCLHEENIRCKRIWAILFIHKRDIYELYFSYLVDVS